VRGSTTLTATGGGSANPMMFSVDSSSGTGYAPCPARTGAR
jgi:hypothetical protein